MLLTPFRIASQMQQPPCLQLASVREAVQVALAQHEDPFQLTPADELIQLALEPEAGVAPPFPGNVVRTDRVPIAFSGALERSYIQINK
ncbi:hypothetical protein ACIQXD_37070 [Streptomyces uncialis]|uniref:hypothetical protein n=1 Tax=Streptomyces uncialis TaxID=1048205 RepID=UPI003814E795